MSSASDYVRIRQIGQGGFADAHLVELSSDRTKRFVLKEMTYNGKDEKKDCLAEVDMLRQLNHPHIVAFRDSFSGRHVIYLVMEYCSGGDLGQYLKAQSNHLVEARILHWTYQILQALQYLHGRLKPVLHRDMKPGNIFLTESQSVKIGDFGISRELVHRLDLATTFCGTPLYLAPEIYRQEAYDHKCDIWSLGCCVYEMMALKPAINPLLLVTLNIVSVNPMPTNYSDDLLEIVQQMLCVDPAGRPSATQSIDQVRKVVKHRQDSPAPGPKEMSSVADTPPSSPSAHSAFSDGYDMPVDSLIIHRKLLGKANGPAATAAPPCLEDEYDTCVRPKRSSSVEADTPPSSPSAHSASSDGYDMPVDSLIIHRKFLGKANGPAATAAPPCLEDEYDTCISFDEFEKTLTNDPVPIQTAAWHLMTYDYKFEHGRLVKINTGEGFKYDLTPRKHENEERYRGIAKAVTEYVYELLEKDLGMQRIYLPFDYQPGEPWTFVYVTPDIFSNAQKLLILIGGAGPIRAGIWSRKAVINDSIDAGSQIPQIRKATTNGYAVLLLNQNQTFLEVGGVKVKIRENRDEMEHALYVWDKLILNNTKVQHIAIMAHSEGTEIATKLAIARKDSFMQRVFAVAMCHPRKEDLLQGAPKDIVDLFTAQSKTWIASKKPLDTVLKKNPFAFFFSKDKHFEPHSAGDERPEWAVKASMNSAFEFINKQYENRLDQRYGN